jgi:hypothetical protein
MDPSEEALRKSLRPVQSAPPLWRLNGCGTIMIGVYSDPRTAPMFYSILFFTFLLIPIVPFRIYLVSTRGVGHYVFHATIGRRDFNALYKHGYAKLLWNGVAKTFLVLVAALFVVAILIAALSKFY